jgi:long-chain acyl-CoA synthetase
MSPGSFYALSATQPQRPAIIVDAGKVLTFGELGQRVNRLSHGLRSHDLAAGDVAAILIRNGYEFYEIMLAALQVGIIVVPVNWHLTKGEINYILADSEAKLVVAAGDLARDIPLEDLPRHRYVIEGEVVPGWLPYARLSAGQSAHAPDDRRAGSMMMYTSGTTGRPKGVHNLLPPGGDPDSYAATVLMAIPRRYGVNSARGVHLVCAPLYHGAAAGHSLGFLHSGHTVVVLPRFEPEMVLSAIERYRVNSVHLVPTHFHRLLQLPDEIRSRYDLSSLTVVVHAAAPCPVPIKRQMMDWLGPVIWEYFGSTEGLVSVVSPQEWLERPGTVGHVLPGLTVKTIDDDGREVPPGEPGTIYFGHPGSPPWFEYHNDPEKTEASRRGDLVTAGDYGYVDHDGYVYLMDRRTDLIISGGVNIYPSEVEQRLLTHPAVHDAAVIGVPDPEWGRIVVALVQPTAGAVPGEDLTAQLLAHCRQGLASFKCPRRLEFVSEFPRTEAGKVQRRLLRDSYASETGSR